MQNAAYRAIGFDGCYFPIEIGTDHLGDIVSALRYMNVPGFAVTKPNKVEILKYLDELDSLAAIMGACNTVVNTNGILKGYNTDGEGCVTDLRRHGISIAGSSFFCLGAGGAGKAVCFALAKHGAAKFQIADIVGTLAKELAEDLNRNFGSIAAHCNSADEHTLPEMVRASNVLMNMSGVGMYPHINETWIEKKHLAHKPTCLDATYNPSKTRFLADAEQVGCKIINGLGMSIYQGALQIKLWTGKSAPIDIMTDEISAILKGR